MTEIRNFCFLNKFLSGHNFCLLTSLVFHKRVNANIEKVCFNPEIYSSNPEVLKCDQEKHFYVDRLVFKVVFGCPMTSLLLRDHILLSVKELLRIVLCLCLVTFLTECDRDKKFLFS